MPYMIEELKKAIELPRSSFTAFRLIYASSKEVSAMSTCLLLGDAPSIWMNDKGPGMLASFTRTARKIMKGRLKEAVVTIHKSTRNGAELKMSTSNLEPQYPDSKLSEGSDDPSGGLPSRQTETSQGSNVISEVQRPPTAEDQFSRILNEMFRDENSEETANDNESTTEADFSEEDGPVKSPVKSYFNVSDLEEAELGSSLGSLRTSEVDSGSRFSDPKPEKAPLRYLDPAPLDQIEPLGKKKYRDDPRDHHHLLKKVKHITRRHKGEPSATTRRNLRSKIFRGLLSRFSAGEVVRMDRMLVLTKIVPKSGFHGNVMDWESVDFRVYQRWREYMIVLRKTSDPYEPLDIQFYEFHSISGEVKKEPDISVRLSEKIKAQIYSRVDKAISLAIPDDDDSIVYVMRCQSAVNTIRWLYFIRLFTDSDIETYFDISIPDLSLSVDVKLPLDKILNSFIKPKSIKVMPVDYGYNIYCHLLMQEIKEKVMSKLELLSSMDVKRFVDNDDLLKFCFRDFDRLEWLGNDSRLFVELKQIFKDHFKLELRVAEGYTGDITLPNGDFIVEPPPIEGFLARMTNSYGKSRLKLRVFHKLLYFYSSENALFYTRYYRASLPSQLIMAPQNELSSSKEVYKYCPFPLNEQGHIPWLESPEFHYHDALALNELERRCEQVIKAQGVIDLCRVKFIRKVSLNDISNVHKVLLSALFYNTADIHDESVIDSVFEMVFYNGEVCRFQAPTRELREIWMEKLTELSLYWKRRKSHELMIQVELGEKNQKNLHIDEYVYSNIYTAATDIEWSRGLSDPLLFGLNSIAMPKCLLQSGYLYQKNKRHSNFTKYFAILCPGFIVLFKIFKKSKSGVGRKMNAFEHYLTIPIAKCYVYSGFVTGLDLLRTSNLLLGLDPVKRGIARIHSDGWTSSEEDTVRCFTLWFGKKRHLAGTESITSRNNSNDEALSYQTQRNPNLVKMASKLGVTGNSVVFMTNSRLETEIWVTKILAELDRLSE